ncbi:PREDICTED: uncharacterized protein LOC107185528 [Dufourea novaeangliae]|uniref:uncharacterized protein LOC107185528 n=1 Tax=Dufourea novaeangliae TaxID=178035 RepID=UPI0007678EDF|nr:PREDICTED: uncharacterized protein LOC107185528 [Dufourea novaeangliae]
MATTSEQSLSTSSICGRHRPLGSQAREIVYNVYAYLAENKKKFLLEYNVLESTSDATGVSRSTINRIVRERKKSITDEDSTFPFAPKKRGGQNKIEFSPFAEGAIRRKIHEFYLVRKEYPSLTNLLNALREDGTLTCSRESLRLKIRDLGFEWNANDQSNRKLLTEKPDIVSWRLKYLQAIKKFRQSNQIIVYLGTTDWHTLSITTKCWQSPEEISRGKKVIIVRGGGEMGFILNSLLLFKSKTPKQDEHSNINGTTFMKWVRELVIPNLPQTSVVIVDNTPYHCFNENIKSTVMQNIKVYPASKESAFDKLLQSHGHEVLRLPPYHVDLNPIELVWWDIKNKVDKECLSTKLKENKDFLLNSFYQIAVEKWKSYCTHVQKIEDEYLHHNELMEGRMDILIAQVEDSASFDESSEDD